MSCATPSEKAKLESTHTAIGGRKWGRPVSLQPRVKPVGCVDEFHQWKIHSGPVPALNFKLCGKCKEIVWLPPDRVW